MTPTPLLFCLWRTDTFTCMSAPLSVLAGEAAPLQRFLSGKFDAETGEIIWQTSYDCSSEDSVSGGVQSTIAVGKEELSDNIYVTVARTGGQAQGVLACIDKNTGKVNWET